MNYFIVQNLTGIYVPRHSRSLKFQHLLFKNIKRNLFMISQLPLYFKDSSSSSSSLLVMVFQFDATFSCQLLRTVGAASSCEMSFCNKKNYQGERAWWVFLLLNKYCTEVNNTYVKKTWKILGKNNSCRFTVLRNVQTASAREMSFCTLKFVNDIVLGGFFFF